MGLALRWIAHRIQVDSDTLPYSHEPARPLVVPLMAVRTMDDRRFDSLTRQAGAGNRRGFLKVLLGLGGAAVTSAVLLVDTDAARRGFSGPSLPMPTPTPTPPPCTPQSSNYCGVSGTCCPEGQWCSPYGCCSEGDISCLL